jgi:hypothetical protein
LPSRSLEDWRKLQGLTKDGKEPSRLYLGSVSFAGGQFQDVQLIDLIVAWMFSELTLMFVRRSRELV